MSEGKTTTNVTTIEKRPLPEAWEKVLVQGELQHLNPEQRAKYYLKVCESLNLNHLTKPFEYITLNGRLTLYAKKDCTDQLRATRKISIKITSREVIEDLYIVTAQASDPSGRTDESIGAISIKNLSGTDRANALMKAETKAKRRVTLSICGLGFLDETETEDASVTSAAQPVRAVEHPDYLPDVKPPCTAESFVANLNGISGCKEVFKDAIARYAAKPEWRKYAEQIIDHIGKSDPILASQARVAIAEPDPASDVEVPEAELFPFEK